MHLSLVVSVLALALLAGQPQPASSPLSGGRQGCRVFPVAATQVTESPSGRSVVTYTARFNRYQSRLKGEMITSGNKQSRSSNEIETEWETVADFVNEIARTIPPLKLSKRTKMGGEAPATIVNGFDAGGRLVRSVSSNGSTPPVTTVYTGWDRFGRTTSGSLVTAAFSQSIAMVYDDAARTQTTTYTTIPKSGATTTSVLKETFDENGNTLLLDRQTPAGRSTTTMTFQKTDVVCVR